MGTHRHLISAAALVMLAACGANPAPAGNAQAGPPYDVVSEVVKDAKTQQIEVWAPAPAGRWPMVFAVPGVGGHRTDFDHVGPALARQGVVVFASDYRVRGTDQQVTADLVCGYRYARTVAGRYGADLSRPITALGYSRGAVLSLGGLQEAVYGPGGSYGECYEGAAVPDVVVAIDGCYYAYKDLTYEFPIELLDHKDAHVVLLSGQKDDVCAPWQSTRVAKELDAAGYDTTLIPIPDANHYQPIFHDLVGGRWVTEPDNPAGKKTVQAVLDAIRAAES
jgi:predicted esterase